ncbi:unnamed protein product [Spirodela intermedia]|uniref:Uncharacterized protein n=1 Tax=Spirodela intermedia TaxID=51605 RepID=A0A7I8J7M8_SPIIN|nr:unnamed protein product [Spirodela intermedia]CAA6666050.1 unnamed protein product [Spirodela intermedia]
MTMASFHATRRPIVMAMATPDAVCNRREILSATRGLTMAASLLRRPHRAPLEFCSSSNHAASKERIFSSILILILLRPITACISLAYMGWTAPKTTAERLPTRPCFHSGAFMARSLEKDGGGREPVEMISSDIPEAREARFDLGGLCRSPLLLVVEEGKSDSYPDS